MRDRETPVSQGVINLRTVSQIANNYVLYMRPHSLTILSNSNQLYFSMIHGKYTAFLHICWRETAGVRFTYFLTILLYSKVTLQKRT